MLQDVARELHKLCAYLTKTMSEIKINCIRNVTKMYADFYILRNEQEMCYALRYERYEFTSY